MNSKHISSNVNNTKKILNALLAIVAFSVPILSANPSQSLSDYPRHAHPFRKIGSSYSQSAGDAKCRKIFYDLSAPIRSSRPPFADENYTETVSFPDVYAYDSGVRINGASHIWYHQQNGECVANIGKY
jgi:hypothetical protein